MDAGDKRGYAFALLFALGASAVVGLHDYRQRLYRYYNPLGIRVWVEFGTWHAAVTGRSVKPYSDEVRIAALAAIREALAEQLAEDFDPEGVGVKFDHRRIRDGLVTTYYVGAELVPRER